MDAAITGLIGTAIGAIAGMTGTLITSDRSPGISKGNAPCYV